MKNLLLMAITIVCFMSINIKAQRTEIVSLKKELEIECITIEALVEKLENCSFDINIEKGIFEDITKDSTIVSRSIKKDTNFCIIDQYDPRSGILTENIFLDKELLRISRNEYGVLVSVSLEGETISYVGEIKNNGSILFSIFPEKVKDEETGNFCIGTFFVEIVEFRKVLADKINEECYCK
ncbi:MAG: hypothetical protein WCI41_02435 [bacterium]